MKEYRLVGWPELDSARNRTAYRRVLSEMSQRHVPLEHLMARSGLGRHEVARLLDDLGARGFVSCREFVPPAPTRLALPRWLRRAVASLQAR